MQPPFQNLGARDAWLFSGLVWTIVATIRLVSAWPDMTATLYADPDATLRLVQARDWMAGRPLDDFLQPRLNPPDGVAMHWARWPDAVLGGAIIALQPLLGAQAETAVLGLAPTVLFFLYGLAGLALARALSPTLSPFAAAVFLLGAVVATETLEPAKIDHHGLQVVFALSILASVVHATRTRTLWCAVLGGALAGISLGVGLEGLNIVLAVLGGLGLGWVLRLSGAGPVGLAFSGGMAAITAAIFAARYDAIAGYRAACDAVSWVYLSAGVASVGVFAALSALDHRMADRRVRAMSGALIAGIAGAGLLAAFPHCAGGPYSEIPDVLKTLWLSDITEAKPLWATPNRLTLIVSGLGPALVVGLAAGAVLVSRNKAVDRASWGVCLAALGIASLVMIGQIRGVVLTAALSAALGAAVFAQTAGLSVWRRVGVGLACCGFPYAALAAALPAQRDAEAAQEEREARSCPPEAYAAFAKLTPGTALAHPNAAPRLLAETPHGVVGGHYHRNVEGLIRTYALFQNPHDANALGGIDYVVVCTPDAWWSFTEDHPNGFAVQLVKGEPLVGLTPVVEVEDFTVWRVGSP
ncbi:MAG: hypothetical protein ACFB2Z_05340 [Maricaulaceae bacterium]